MKKPLFLFFSLLCFVASLNAQDFELVWEDNFEGNTVDLTKWKLDTGNGCPDLCGWGNNEKQHYKAENAKIEDGNLVITATKTSNHYTSAKLISQAQGELTYGRIEVRAKLPKGKGLWPAIWMLPVDWDYGGWPKSGEIDIMEHVGYAPNKVFGTVHTEAFNHTKGTQQGDSILVNDLSTAFHTFAIEWSESQIDFFVNDSKYFTFQNQEGYTSAEWPFDKPFQLILNLAVGGNWGGKYGINDAVFPQQFVIDYVRFYQLAQP